RMATQRQATAVWSGNVRSGNGTVSLDDSRLLSDAPVSWAARTEAPAPGKTSPEELLAAAHAACFCMALSNGLAKAGSPAERLTARASATFDKVDGGFAITAVTIDVEGRVPGMDEDAFRNAASQAGQGCPVSKALKGNVRIDVQARLATS